MLIVYKNMFEIYRLKTQLRGEFEMKDLGAREKLDKVIHGDQEVGELCLSRKKCIEKVLEYLERKGQSR